MTGPDDPVRTVGPTFSDKGVFQGARLLVSERHIPTPSARHRNALSNYAGLMYIRAPKLEAAILEYGRVYEAATQAEIDRVLPGTQVTFGSDMNSTRARMLRIARNAGAQLAVANWWILRASAQGPFVLGDNPVVTTVSLGHDDSWRPILSGATYLVGIALGPTVALLIAPQQIIPVTGVEGPEDATRAVNRLIWRSADRYVVAKDRASLDVALSSIRDDARQATVPVDFDTESIARSAVAVFERTTSQVAWMIQLPAHRWEGCRLVFGYPDLIERAEE